MTDYMQTHPHNREQWGKQWGKDDVRLPCLPDRAHLDSLLQALRPVHVQFIERNTCNAARNATIPCFVDGLAPALRGHQNEFGAQVLIKWWYARELLRLNYHVVFSDRARLH